MMDKSTKLNTDISNNYIAALDIGSNSFHFVYARIKNNHLQILHKEKYRVQLAQGLTKHNILDKAAIDRGINTLKKLALTTQHLTPDNFRVVATYTLRTAENIEDFLAKADKIFPFDIEVISGHEEARLIYQGVAYYSDPTQQRLVIDIGGGSTECVIGKKNTIKTLASLPIGCVSFQQRFFAHGVITATSFNNAIFSAKREIESIYKRFSKIGWQTTIGTSGTIKAISSIINSGNIDVQEPTFTLKELHQLKLSLIKFAHIDNIKLKSLKDNRRNTLCSGLSILIALVEMLKIDHIGYCNYSLREGVLAELLPYTNSPNVQNRTINSLITRFTIDEEQADYVKTLAIDFYQQVNEDWLINNKRYKNLLQWSALLHEIGLDINPSSYHKHGQYILTHSDLAGFNQETQSALAFMVGFHRKKIIIPSQDTGRLYQQDKLLKLCVLLRLSVLLTQQRKLTELPFIKIMTTNKKIILEFQKTWIKNNPIINADLLTEQQNLAELGVTLTIKND